MLTCFQLCSGQGAPWSPRGRMHFSGSWAEINNVWHLGWIKEVQPRLLPSHSENTRRRPILISVSRLSPAHSHVPPQEEEGSKIPAHTCQQPFTPSFPQRAAKCCFQEEKHIFSTVINKRGSPLAEAGTSPSTHTQLGEVMAGWDCRAGAVSGTEHHWESL